jgi:hypothetical protein
MFASRRGTKTTTKTTAGVFRDKFLSRAHFSFRFAHMTSLAHGQPGHCSPSSSTRRSATPLQLLFATPIFRPRPAVSPDAGRQSIPAWSALLGAIALDALRPAARSSQNHRDNFKASHLEHREFKMLPQVPTGLLQPAFLGPGGVRIAVNDGFRLLAGAESKARGARHLAEIAPVDST